MTAFVKLMHIIGMLISMCRPCRFRPLAVWGVHCPHINMPWTLRRGSLHSCAISESKTVILFSAVEDKMNNFLPFSWLPASLWLPKGLSTNRVSHCFYLTIYVNAEESVWQVDPLSLSVCPCSQKSIEFVLCRWVNGLYFLLWSSIVTSWLPW